MTDVYPKSKFDDPVPGWCVNGTRRGADRAEYDWLQDGRRVECKSASLTWASHRWGFSFRSVKFAADGTRCAAAFDRLILGLYTPQRIYVYLHDGVLGKAAQGVRTATQGHVVQVRGPYYERDWHIALNNILGKLDLPTNSCERIAEIPLNDHRIGAIFDGISNLTQHAYLNTPLADLSGAARGLRIEAMMRRVDARLHTGACWEEGESPQCVDGRARGWNMKGCDWIRNGQRIECKSSQLTWCGCLKRWKVAFHGVKFGAGWVSAFDELLLALYTPAGLYIYRHDFKLGVSRAGLKTATIGHMVQISGPRGEQDWQKALSTILDNFNASGCKLIAVISWD